MQALHDFLVHVNPEPHRRTFMKPFIRNQTADFCSTCHKVHLDTHVNNYRWIRGFNDYDNWQASGVSGLGARSFYYPPKTRLCADCHMPLLDSHDAGNVNGKDSLAPFPRGEYRSSCCEPGSQAAGRSDRISAEQHPERATSSVFRLRARSKPTGAADVASRLATTFAVGEEGDVGAAAGRRRARSTDRRRWIA